MGMHVGVLREDDKLRRNWCSISRIFQRTNLGYDSRSLGMGGRGLRKRGRFVENWRGIAGIFNGQTVT